MHDDQPLPDENTTPTTITSLSQNACRTETFWLNEHNARFDGNPVVHTSRLAISRRTELLSTTIFASQDRDARCVFQYTGSVNA